MIKRVRPAIEKKAGLKELSFILVRQPRRLSNRLFQGLVLLFILLVFALIFFTIGNLLWHGMAEMGNSLKSPEIWFAIRLSFLTASISTLMCLLLALPIAYGLERFSFRGQHLIGTVFNIPMALPPIVSGLALLLIFGTTEWGRRLAAYGLKFVFTVNGIILAQFFVNISYLIRLLRSSIADINPRYEFVARTLGCSQWQAFRKVVLPLVRNGLLAGVVTTWSRGLGEFGAALMLAGATRMKTELLPISVYLNLSTGDLDLAMAAASILVVFSLLSLLVFEILGGKQSEIAR